MKIDFDRQRITDRMNTLGLSEREVVRASGIPYAQFRQARKTGQFDGHVTLAQLDRLAAQLGLTISELLASADGDSTSLPEPSEVTDAEDVASVVPLLLAVPRLVAIPHVARTLGWSRERLSRALAATPAALDGTGLCLREIRGSVKIEPTNTSSKAVRHTIARLQTSTYGLNTRETQTLLRITEGERVAHRNVGKQQQLVFGALSNKGCIETDDRGQYRPTVDLRLALPDLDQPLGKGQ
jgi:hypothetical protein